MGVLLGQLEQRGLRGLQAQQVPPMEITMAEMLVQYMAVSPHLMVVTQTIFKETLWLLKFN
jgi:hypothetical protein